MRAVSADVEVAVVNREDFMNVQDLLTKPIEELAPNDRLRLIADLIAASPVKQLRPSSQCCVMLLSTDGVRPGEVRNVQQRNYCEFRISSLVIVNTSREIEDVAVTEKTGPGKRSHKTTHTRRIVESPASAWSIQQMFSGNYNVFPGAPSGGPGFPGIAFSVKCPNGARTLGAGLDVSMRVSHNLTTPADFRALLFGVPTK